MFSKLSAIISNTFTETIRQPIFGVLLWVAAGLLVMNPSIAAYSMSRGDDNKVMFDVGLSTLLLYGLLASVFSATTVISREIETHTVLTVVSKPVGRPTFLLGKYVGVAAAVLVGFYFLSLVFLMTVRHGVLETVAMKVDQPVLYFGLTALAVSLVAAVWSNYVYGWHFATTLLAWVIPLGTLAVFGVMSFSPKWEPQSPLTDFGDGQIASALVMVLAAFLMLTAFAVALSTRFGQVVTLILCAGVFLLGLMSDYYFGRNVAEGDLYALLYAVVPNFQVPWAGDALTQEQRIPPAMVGSVLGYGVAYSLAIVALGVALFETREVS